MSSSYGFDLKALEIFVQIVETGNMTTAGQRLGMSQSSISQALSNLEESLHSQLIDRSVRPLTLTTAGRYFYDRAQNLLSEARRTSSEMRKADFKLLRHVKIALVDSIVTSVGQPLIDVVKQRTQNWSMITGQSHLHGHMLLSRQADVIISDDPVDNYSGLTRFRLLREPFVVAVPRNYEGEPELSKIFQKLDFIRYSANSLIAQEIERYLRRGKIEWAIAFATG